MRRPHLDARALFGLVVVGCALVAPTGLWAQPIDRALAGEQAATPLADPAREAELDAATAAIGEKLRCPVCRQQSIVESPDDLAREMLAVIRQKLIEGETPEEIEAYFIDAYGPWILLQPPAEGVNLLIYIGPAVGFLLGGLLLWSRAKRLGADEPEDASPAPEDERWSKKDRAWLEDAIREG